MEEFLYTKDCYCPVCRAQFKTKKVRTRGLRMETREEDFNVIYRGINPLYYQIWVCPKCGYSATEGEFQNITTDQKKAVQEAINGRWQERDYGGIRTWQQALVTFKLALFCGTVIKKRKSYIGGLCLRIAWLYREKNDPNEIQFLQQALSYFVNTYQYERLPVGNMDDILLAYLNGELNRRLGNYKEGIKWFSTALQHPDIKRKRQIQILVREQWRLAKEQYDEEK